jgi:hypothetical protein
MPRQRKRRIFPIAVTREMCREMLSFAVSKATIDRAIQAGDLPVHRSPVGKQTALILVRDIESWIESWSK